MIRIKVMRMSGIVYIIIVIFLITAILFLGGKLLLGSKSDDFESNSVKGDIDNESLRPVYKSMLSGGVPALRTGSAEKAGFLTGIWNALSFNKLRDPRTIIHCIMPYLGSEAFEADPSFEYIEVNKPVNIPDRSNVDRKIPDPPERDQDGKIDMDSNLPEEVMIRIKSIEDDQKPIELKKKGKGPQILIYHTHSREAYRQDSKNQYKVVEAFRTDDLNYTVVRVGMELAASLEKKGIDVLHDTTEHEQGNYDTAYENSLKTLKKRIKENSSLQIFLDIHRNAYKDGSKKPDDEVVVIDGKRVAKVFVVIGTGEGVLGGFNEKPDWEKNYKFGLKLTNKINELYPGLAKDVYVRSGRFNQHISNKSLLIEIGSTLTTLEESKRAARYVAEALSQIVK